MEASACGPCQGILYTHTTSVKTESVAYTHSNSLIRCRTILRIHSGVLAVAGFCQERTNDTGGARGMMAAYVSGFLAEGARVVAADLSWDGIEAFRDEVKAADGLPRASGRRDHA